MEKARGTLTPRLQRLYRHVYLRVLISWGAADVPPKPLPSDAVLQSSPDQLAECLESLSHRGFKHAAPTEPVASQAPLGPASVTSVSLSTPNTHLCA